MAATYDLALIHQLVRLSRYRITGSAAAGAWARGFDALDIVECVLGLQGDDFYKTMPSTTLPGRWQDVYRPNYQGVVLYVKVQVLSAPDEQELLVIISFKGR